MTLIQQRPKQNMDNILTIYHQNKKHPVQFVEMVGFSQKHKIYTVRDINMKLIYKLFHRMINRSSKFHGYSLIYNGDNLDVPVLLLTLGRYILRTFKINPII